MSRGREKAVRILTDTPHNVPGTVAVRVDATKNQRIDYYLDPRRDYICRRKVTWSGGGEWSVRSIDELLDLQMLPSGQWFASKMRFTRPTNRKPVTEFNVDIRLMKDDEFPPGVFDPKEIVEEAKRQGLTFPRN